MGDFVSGYRAGYGVSDPEAVALLQAVLQQPISEERLRLSKEELALRGQALKQQKEKEEKRLQLEREKFKYQKDYSKHLEKRQDKLLEKNQQFTKEILEIKNKYKLALQRNDAKAQERLQKQIADLKFKLQQNQQEFTLLRDDVEYERKLASKGKDYKHAERMLNLSGKIKKQLLKISNENKKVIAGMKIKSEENLQTRAQTFADNQRQKLFKQQEKLTNLKAKLKDAQDTKQYERAKELKKMIISAEKNLQTMRSNTAEKLKKMGIAGQRELTKMGIEAGEKRQKRAQEFASKEAEKAFNRQIKLRDHIADLDRQRTILEDNLRTARENKNFKKASKFRLELESIKDKRLKAQREHDSIMQAQLFEFKSMLGKEQADRAQKIWERRSNLNFERQKTLMKLREVIDLNKYEKVKEFRLKLKNIDKQIIKEGREFKELLTERQADIKKELKKLDFKYNKALQTQNIEAQKNIEKMRNALRLKLGKLEIQNRLIAGIKREREKRRLEEKRDLKTALKSKSRDERIEMQQLLKTRNKLKSMDTDNESYEKTLKDFKQRLSSFINQVKTRKSIEKQLGERGGEKLVGTLGYSDEQIKNVLNEAQNLIIRKPEKEFRRDIESSKSVNILKSLLGKGEKEKMIMDVELPGAYGGKGKPKLSPILQKINEFKKEFLEGKKAAPTPALAPTTATAPQENLNVYRNILQNDAFAPQTPLPVAPIGQAPSSPFEVTSPQEETLKAIKDLQRTFMGGSF